MYRNDWNLVSQTIELSKSKNWDDAKEEWYLYNIYEAEDEDDLETCACGHYPIKEIIVLKNKYTNSQLIVGNCCIKKFGKFESDYNRFFKALKKNKINMDIIKQSYEDEVINDWEFRFIKNVWRKRNFTEKQSKKYNQIKDKIFDFYKKKMVSSKQNT